jgi:hypothetical chaperone protein
VFGQAAVTEYLDGYSGRFMRSLKSILGNALIHETTQIGTERRDFKQIIGLFIDHIRATAEQSTGLDLDSVVMGRPVRFVDDDDMADQAAENELCAIAEAQGFRHVSFEYEPLAAARDYESRLEREELVLVADIGGGTSDFSVIRLSPESRMREDRSRDILANAGIHIGGTDFDKQFSLSALMPEFGYRSLLKSGVDVPLHYYHTLSTWHLINSFYSPKNRTAIKSLVTDSEEPDLVARLLQVIDNQRGHELASIVEAAKIALSDRDETIMDAGFIEDDLAIAVTIDDLEDTVAQDIDRIIAVASNSVTKLAGIDPSRIDTIFMTGGSTALPGFEDRMRMAFPAATINYGDRFSSVANGLGLCALQRYG